jgi:prefoldin subunit 5
MVNLVPKEVVSLSPEALEADRRAQEELAELKQSCQVLDELLSKLTPVAKSIRKALKERKPGHHGMISIGSNYRPEIIVGKGSIQRVLLIFCTLDQVAASRGQKIYEQEGKLLWQVHDETFAIRIKEVQDKAIHEPTKQELKDQARQDEWRERHPDWYTSNRKAYREWDYIPSGRISILIQDTYGNRWDQNKVEKRWRDRKNRQLEDYLPEIFIWLESASIAAREKRLEIEQQQLQEARRQELARQRRARRENAEALEKRILELADTCASIQRVADLVEYLKLVSDVESEPLARLIAETEGYQRELRLRMKLADIEDVLSDVSGPDSPPLLITALSEIEPAPQYGWQRA